MPDDIVIARPRLDCSFKPGPVPDVPQPPRNTVLARFGAFIDGLERHHRDRGDRVTVLVRPLWQFDAPTLAGYVAAGATVYVPHKLRAQFPIGANALYYKNAPLDGLYTVDPAGWGASLSFLPPAPIDDGTMPTLAALRSRIRDNRSVFDQPAMGPPPLPEPYPLFVCQLPHDETIAFHSDVSVDQALAAVLAYGEARGRRVVVKGHPANPRSMAPLRERTLASPVGHWVDAVSIHACLAGSDRVFLVNSGAGFEALLHDRTVIRFGRAEYDSVTPRADPEAAALLRLDGYRHSGADYAAFLRAFASHCIDPSCPDSYVRVIADAMARRPD